MIRGTTPSIGVRLPISIDNIKELELIIKQRGDIIVDRTIEDFRVYDTDNCLAITTLTQEETLAMSSLNNYEKVRVQAAILYKDGSVDKTPIVLIPVDEILKDEIMS